MRIGEKVKKLRTAKFMTQQELVGNYITRNMLSLIENGSASPSLETVCYLAQRLGVSAGFLLVDDDNDFSFRKISNMSNIKKAYLSSEFSICHQLCLSVLKTSNGYCEDDEINLLLCECSLGLAREKIFDGKLYQATIYIDEALENTKKTIYDTTQIKVRASIYGRYISGISQTLYTDFDESLFMGYDCLATSDMFCKYISALFAIDTDDIKSAEKVVEQIKNDSPYLAQHIRGKLYVKNGEISLGAELFKKLLNSNMALPETVVYDLFGDLEFCCRNTDDFKGAYEYSKSKITMLERFISDRED